MAKYIEIKGHSIQSVDTDPVVYAGAWSSGGNLNQGRLGMMSSGGGTLTAGLVFGGYKNDSAAAEETESYNGTAWTELADLNTARMAAGGCGATNTAALAFGGSIPPKSAANEQWDGSSWTEVGDLNLAREGNQGTGTSTAALTFGGEAGSPASRKGETESWDGSSWTEVGDLNTVRMRAGGAGTSTAALAFGGFNPPNYLNVVESWNGSAWTETTEINTGRSHGGSTGATSTSALLFGGKEPSKSTKTESWDGTSWTEVADLATAVDGNIGTAAGSNTEGMSVGGQTPAGDPGVATTEEWSFPSAPAVQEGQVWFNTVSATLKGYAAQGTGAWAAGGNLNSAHSEKPGGVGTQTASLCFGGNPYLQTNEEYNGTSWSEKGDLNTGRMRLAASKAGTVTAALAIAGEVPPNSDTVNVESWNGSAWTEIANVNTARRLLGGAGTQTSAIGFAGTTAHPAATGETAIAEEWNGSAWSEVGDLNTARFGLASAGENAENALAISGNTGSITAVVEKWDGTSWTEVGDVNTGRDGRAGAGTATAALGFGGYNPGNTVNTETWNGSSWTEVANLSTATNSASGTGAGNVTALNSGGNADTDGTEEWTVPGATKTLSVS